jgi:hypothetical protein
MKAFPDRPSDVDIEVWREALEDVYNVVFVTRFGDGIKRLGYKIVYLDDDGRRQIKTVKAKL